MALVDRVYELLAGGQTPDADRALGVAALDAGSPYFERIVALLFSRANVASWAGLIGVYDRLNDEQRAALRAEGERTIDALSAALRARSPAARCNALQVQLELLTPRVAFILPDLLRDPSVEVREQATGVLRALTAQFVENRLNAGTSGTAPPTSEQRTVCDALLAALRTIDLHLCVDVLEPCLWCSEWIAEVWDAIDRPRSRAAHVLSENLARWDDAKLAPFLLRALARNDLRRDAQRLLGSWHTSLEVTALLAHSHLLDDEEICRNVAGIKEPAWFANLASLEEIAAPLRRFAPRWVCAAGYASFQKAAILQRWTRARDPDLALAAIQHLERIDMDEALPILRRVAESDSRHRQAAAELLVRMQIEHLERSLVNVPHRDAGAERAPADAEFASLWGLLRRTKGASHRALVEIVVAGLARVAPHVAAKIESEDPLDRVQAIEIAYYSGVCEVIRPAMERLVRDPLEALRRLADSVMRSVGPSAASGAAPTPAGETARGRVVSAAQRERFSEVLRQIAARVHSGRPIEPALLDGLYEIIVGTPRPKSEPAPAMKGGPA
ncbi:MAG: hypothetical protein CHACPFDD_00151 [Phycisphaerae bacterium]|nr:hypothetical protein [Phycisphaerae bacterium]